MFRHEAELDPVARIAQECFARDVRGSTKSSQHMWAPWQSLSINNRQSSLPHTIGADSYLLQRPGLFLTICGVRRWCAKPKKDGFQPFPVASGDLAEDRHAEGGHLIENLAGDFRFNFLGEQSPGPRSSPDSGANALRFYTLRCSQLSSWRR